MRIDYERFLRTAVTVTNEGGQRRYETGLRTFDCPFCGDRKARGWLGVYRHAAGCWNPGCVAEPQLEGGALEWARRFLRLASRAETRELLEREYGTDAPDVPRRAPERGDDWCRLPAASRPFDDPSPMREHFSRFAQSQWGVPLAEAQRWELRWSLSGPHAWRIVIPVTMYGQCVGFQTRTIRKDVNPKYLTSSSGLESEPRAECGRPAAAMLFNVDAVRENQEVLMVEGAGDVMGWHARAESRQLPAVGILGLAMTVGKMHALKTARPRRVIVAPDAGEAEHHRALAHIDDLNAFGFDAVLGTWVGGKDAGSGARLQVGSASDFAEQLRARLQAPRERLRPLRNS